MPVIKSAVPGLLVAVMMSGKSLEEVNLTLLELEEVSGGCLASSWYGTSSGDKAGDEADFESGRGVAVDLLEAPVWEALGTVSTAMDLGDMDWRMARSASRCCSTCEAVRVTAPMTLRRDLL